MGMNTNNYNLIKPAPEDFYNIQDYNGNMDIIDGQLKKLDTEKEAVIQKKTAFNKNYETSSTNIKMNGTVNVGSSDTIARGDHVHPTDTSRAASTHNHDGVYATAAQGTKADAAATQTGFNVHLADYVRQPGYGITTGSANTYTLTLSPAPTVYIDGMGITVKINAANTTASTLNVNGLGAKAIVDSKGNALKSGKLRSNGIYALRYDGTNFVLLGEAIEGSGSKLDADLLDGKEATAFATAEQGTKADAALPAVSYTANDVLTKLKTMDGSGSGIDADLLDGKEATAFATAEQGTKADNALPATSYTASDVLTKLKTVDGSGSGIDADLLDGKDSTAFATAAQGAKADAAATQTSFNAHLADYVRQPGYGITTGSANTYSLTLSPAPTAYIDGMGIAVKINAANTTASTLNVNGLGAKAIVDSKGNALTAGKLRLNGVYALRFDGTNFVLLGEAIEGSGSKLDADLLDGKEATDFATSTQGTKADNALPAASYTASDVLTKLKAVDGSGSGIDADLLDGKEATAFATAEQGTKADNALPAASYTASDVLTKLKTVDGSGSGIDADLLDGKDSTAFATAAQGTKADAAATQTSFNTHLVDYVRQPGYGTTAGSANTYTVTLSPAPTAYIDGMGVVVKINAANTTASTLNVNALGAKAIVDSKGNALIAGKLRLNGVYSLRYDGTNFVLLGEVIEGSGSGLDADLLDGKDSTAFATAAQGTKADAAATQTSFNTHLADATKHKQANGTQTGDYSNAEGYGTRALGNYSHAEGYNTEAGGDFSHAEGCHTNAEGFYSHAEGSMTNASGDVAHAEGSETNASGVSAHAEGYKTTASGINSHAEGIKTTASGICSHAEGDETTASGWAHAEGYDTTASGYYSHAEGYCTTASGYYSHAEGYCTTAFGESSHAEGESTTASGWAHAEGSQTIASSACSHAEGYYTIANAYCSHVEGKNTTADTYASHAGGQYNKYMSGNPASYSTTSDAFVIGNGTEQARSNAFRVTFDGKTYGLSAFNSAGADYAEFFEWTDGNIDNEDRVGYFVTLDGDKIRKAISTDDYILGIVSVNPSVIGDNYADDWSGKYVTDEWGRIQYHDVVVPATYRTVHHAAVYDKNTDKIVTDAYDEEVIINEERTDYVPILNPDWDSSQEYISREHRKEWSAVGMMGKLLVRDDGTCQVNGFCKPNDAGFATTATNGYRVMKRVSEEIVQILIK